MKYWWEEDTEPKRTEEERDNLVLWWKSYVLLAQEGWLRSTPVRVQENSSPRQSGKPAKITNLTDLQRAERTALIKALDDTGWRVKMTAQTLGITTRVCHYKMESYDLVEEYRTRNGWAGRVGRKRLGTTSLALIACLIAAPVFAQKRPLAVAPSAASINVAAMIQLSANGVTGTPQWTSSAAWIATVTSTGLVRGVSPGTAIINVRSGGRNATSLITVNPGPPVVTNCQLSAWYLAEAEAWGACVDQIQTRDETWQRDIVQQPTNGGTPCGLLVEARTGQQMCEAPPPSGNRIVQVLWDEPVLSDPPVESWRVYVGTTPGAYDQIFVTTTKLYVYTASGAGTRYFAVSAVSAFGESAKTTEVPWTFLP